MKKLNEISGMPQMGLAFSGWQKDITLVTITQTVDDDGFVTNSKTTTTFKGVIQPLSAEAIELKPEGQRSFQWLQIHCFAGDLNLKNNDQIDYNDKLYKVMYVKDYSLNNYIEYHVIEDFQ